MNTRSVFSSLLCSLVLGLLCGSNLALAQFQFDTGPSEPVDRGGEKLEKFDLGFDDGPPPKSKPAAKPASKPAQNAGEKVEGSNGPRFGKSRTQSWTTGVRLTAVDPCSNMFFLIPIPLDWPEQKVSIQGEKATNNYAKVTRRVHPNGGLGELRISIPRLRAGDSTEASLTVEVTRREILPPSAESIAKLSIPKKFAKNMKVYLEPSPQIESDKSTFKTLYRDITKDIDSDWEKIEAIYKWVQTNIVYTELTKAKKGKGAVATMKDKVGDCKDLTAVFIAICRAGKIPARTVFVPEHCYAEFYMEDDEGFGYWFPCQVSGSYAFGGIPETGPVLQKGDNFTFREFPKEKFRFINPQGEVIGETPGRFPKHEFLGGPSK